MEFLTIDEVAGILKVHPNTVYTYISSGKLKALKLNGNGPFRINRADLEAFLVQSAKGGE